VVVRDLFGTTTRTPLRGDAPSRHHGWRLRIVIARLDAAEDIDHVTVTIKSPTDRTWWIGTDRLYQGGTPA
jgi:hypothetical protein